MTGNQYLTGLTLYFIGYVLFEVCLPLFSLYTPSRSSIVAVGVFRVPLAPLAPCTDIRSVGKFVSAVTYAFEC